jgi:hypothetical protein
MPGDMPSRANFGGPFAAVDLLPAIHDGSRILHHSLVPASRRKHTEKKGPAGKGRSFKALGRPVFPEMLRPLLQDDDQ